MESEARIISYGQNRQNLLSGPRSGLFFGIQTAVRLPPHPDAPGPLVPWDKTETESKARIMSYGPVFAAPNLAHFSAFKPPLGYPPLSMPPDHWSRGPNGNGIGGPNHDLQPKPAKPTRLATDLAHFWAFKSPRGYPPIPMPPDRWSRGSKRKRNRRPRS